jgi:hypothetical protein
MISILKNKLRSSLAARLLFWVWLSSTLTASVFIAIQITAEYLQEKNSALLQTNLIKLNYAPAITNSIWEFNEDILAIQLKSLRNLKHVCNIQLKTSETSIAINNCEKVPKNTLKNSSIDLHKNGGLPHDMWTLS